MVSGYVPEAAACKHGTCAASNQEGVLYCPAKALLRSPHGEVFVPCDRCVIAAAAGSRQRCVTYPEQLVVAPCN